MIAIQKFVRTGEEGAYVRKFLCMAVNIMDMDSAHSIAETLSDDWTPTTPEEGVYIYDPTTNIASAKYVNGIRAW